LIGKVIFERLQQEKADKIARFRYLNEFVKKGQIVFAGSSLMEQFPIYEFIQDFDLPYTIYNRGVGGFTTTEMIDALRETVYDLSPRYLFLNIGTNDLNGSDYSKEALIDRYDLILRAIEENVPGIKIYLMAYYPVNPDCADNPWMVRTLQLRTNERIAEANEAVKVLASKHNAQFIDVNNVIADDNGNLKSEYTVDGMHMYANGYRQILDALLPILKTINSDS